MTKDNEDYIDSYQRWVDSTCIYPHNRNKLWNVLAMLSEAGEIAQLVEKEYRKGRTIDPEVMKDELGDIMWYLSRTASMYDLKLSDIQIRNIQKIEARLDAGEIVKDG